MEVRQRARRRTRRWKKNDFSPALIVVCVVFITGVYLVGASRLGTWLAESVVAPMIRETVPVQTVVPVVVASTPAPADDAETLAISLPAIRCYAVQIGVYAEADNAEAQSESLRELGAAGYITEDDARFRVLAAGYPEEASMEKVRMQLSDSGIESLAYEIGTDGMRLRVSGTAEQLERLEDALSFAAMLPEQLSALAIRFDRDSLSVTSGITETTDLLSACHEKANMIDMLDEPAYTKLLPIYDYLTDLTARMDDLCQMDDADTVSFSSAIKRLYLDAVFGYRDMALQMDEA